MASSQRTRARFLFSASGILTISGAAKVLSILGKNPVLGHPDPIFGFPLSYLLLSVGLIELAAAVLCSSSVDQELTLRLLAALCLNFLGYRIGLWVIHWPGYCPCLGTMTQVIHLSHRSADLIMLSILAYLLIGSFWFLVRSWAARQIRVATGSGEQLKVWNASGRAGQEESRA